jgi:predicted HicB family RNase H-like nuclease
MAKVEYNGRSQSVQAWADELGLCRQTIYSRLRRYPAHVALRETLPKRDYETMQTDVVYVRMTKKMHENLKELAALKAMSLNQLCLDVLGGFIAQSLGR